jgi:OOP family OmpA-OmpF porin
VAGDDDIDELIDLLADDGRANGTAATWNRPAEPEGRRSRLLLILAVSGVVNIAALIMVGYWLGSRSSTSDGEASSDAAVTTAAEPTGGSATDGSAVDTTAAPTTGSTAALSVVPTADNPEGAVRYAVYTGGQVFLRGFVPSREIGDEIVAKAGAVIGPENVIDEYQVDPRAAMDVALPVYIQDVVLFGFNSSELEPDFVPLLELAIIFLSQNPNATLTVVARTDAVGTQEANLELSQERAQAVIDYWLERGIDPAQIIADPRGEEVAVPEADEQAAALDRRAEFIVNGLLD